VVSDAAIVGILLAAGRGARFGGEKLLADLEGERIGVSACNHLMAAVPDVIVVVRPHDDALAAALAITGARVVSCPNSDDGMGASLAHGVRATIDAKGWVVMLADMPWCGVAPGAADMPNGISTMATRTNSFAIKPAISLSL